MHERRDLTIRNRRAPVRLGGRRAIDRPTANGWTTGQVGWWIGMDSDFVLGEIKDRRLVASKFGREWRVAFSEVCRYCLTNKYPLPEQERSA